MGFHYHVGNAEKALIGFHYHVGNAEKTLRRFHYNVGNTEKVLMGLFIMLVIQKRPSWDFINM